MDGGDHRRHRPCQRKGCLREASTEVSSESNSIKQVETRQKHKQGQLCRSKGMLLCRMGTRLSMVGVNKGSQTGTALVQCTRMVHAPRGGAREQLGEAG